MSDRRYGVYERFDTGDKWPLSSIPDALVEEAAKRIEATVKAHVIPSNPMYGVASGTGAFFGASMQDLSRAALSVLFPGEEKE